MTWHKKSEKIHHSCVVVGFSLMDWQYNILHDLIEFESKEN